ncbi:MAG: ABC transporter permease [Chloroflexota bacterium]
MVRQLWLPLSKTPVGWTQLLALGRTQTAFFWGGMVVLCAITAAAFLSPTIMPYPPDAYVAAPLAGPSWENPLGANEVGQDVLSQVLYGSRVSIAVALSVGCLSVAVALLVGTLAGAVGGFIDGLLMRTVDVVLSIPHLPLLVVLAVFLGPGLANVILLITVLSWARPARIIRAEVLSLRTRGYVRSARLYGAGWPYLLRRHLLPAVMPIATAAAVTLAGRAVLMEAMLAFLGIGDPTLYSWGTMIHSALNYRGLFLTSAWTWWVLPPGICLSLLVLAFTMLGTAAEAYNNARLGRHQMR